MLERMPTDVDRQYVCTMSPIKKTGWQILQLRFSIKADITNHNLHWCRCYPSETDGTQIVICTMDIWMSWTSKAVNQRNWQLPSHSDRWSLRSRTINPKSIFTLLRSRTMGKPCDRSAWRCIYGWKLKKAKLWTFPILQERGDVPTALPRRKMGRVLLRSVGEYQLYKQKIDGGEWIPLTTTLDRTNYRLLWSPDGKKILFGNKDFAIYYIDVDSKKLTQLMHRTRWRTTNSIGRLPITIGLRNVNGSATVSSKQTETASFSLQSGTRKEVCDQVMISMIIWIRASTRVGSTFYYLSSQNYERSDGLLWR